uniref:Uncharacterized protein n=1 Tax=Avena sativa TaxID=4498 RepID=A0ACD5TGM5_AVESA
MAPINVTSKRTYAEMSETPITPRFKDFDDIEYVDTILFSKWSISVRVEVKFPPNSYADNIRFILMDRNGSKIEASVWGHAEVERFNRILQPGCKYVIHRVKINPNAESVEFRAIGHIFELSFDRTTIVEPCLSIELSILPKHLMPFLEVPARPNKTFVVGIVVHCCELECVGMFTKYKQALFMDVWGNFIPVGIWGSKLTPNSYRWSTAENDRPIAIATMLQKDKGFGGLNTSEHTNFTFNPDHPAARPLQGE